MMLSEYTSVKFHETGAVIETSSGTSLWLTKDELLALAAFTDDRYQEESE